eukprot:scaffold105791_cov48-Phaeocystis_antarctica.AAC.1
MSCASPSACTTSPLERARPRHRASGPWSSSCAASSSGAATARASAGWATSSSRAAPSASDTRGRTTALWWPVSSWGLDGGPGRGPGARNSIVVYARDVTEVPRSLYLLPSPFERTLMLNTRMHYV